MVESKQAPEPLAGEVVKRDHRLGIERELRADGDDTGLVGREGMHRHGDDTGTAAQTRLPKEDRFLEDAAILFTAAESESASRSESHLQDRILRRDYSGRRAVAGLVAPQDPEQQGFDRPPRKWQTGCQEVGRPKPAKPILDER